jgi:hypothetical protein
MTLTPINIIEHLGLQIIMIIPHYQGWVSQHDVLIKVIASQSSFLKSRLTYTTYHCVQPKQIVFLVYLNQLDYLSIRQCSHQKY